MITALTIGHFLDSKASGISRNNLFLFAQLDYWEAVYLEAEEYWTRQYRGDEGKPVSIFMHDQARHCKVIEELLLTSVFCVTARFNRVATLLPLVLSVLHNQVLRRECVKCGYAIENLCCFETRVKYTCCYYDPKYLS